MGLGMGLRRCGGSDFIKARRGIFFDGLAGTPSGGEPCALVLRGQIVLAGESDIQLSALGD